ncbi:MAG TPA: prolyl oligopeptidase family serine peptidase [Burkholderiaceae bacterium]
MKSSRQPVLGVILAAWATLSTSASAADPAAAPATVPADTFFRRANMDDVSMSPDGGAIALLVRNAAGRRQLAVIDTADLHRVRIVASFDEYDIAWATWASDKSLVFGLGDESASAAETRGSGLYSIGRDGQNLRVLINLNRGNFETGSHIKVRSLDPAAYSFGGTLHDGSGDIVVLHWTANLKLGTFGSQWISTAPLRMNLQTGVMSEMGQKWPDHVFQWVIDGQGRALAGVQTMEGQTTVLAADGAEWKPLARFPSYVPSADSFDVGDVGADGRMYVSKAAEAAGARALYRYDLAAGKVEGEPVVSARGFDIAGDLVEDYHAHQVLGVHYDADAEGTVWFDPAMKALQAKIDARLPGLVNRIDPADCGCAQRVLVTSHSDHQPPVYFLYDRSDDSLIAFGSSRPAVNPRQMADTDFVRIKARDGLEIPVYVTKPHGKGPWPTVVLVHGGPWVRGWDWRWDPESQFLASRGYLVVKPEFRGSAGYGAALQSAGDRQWGLRMQDDIADATTWAAKQGLADPGRTCIAGASYGGYATLMGLVRYPDLYRCGVAWAAVSDIDLMYDIYWSDADAEQKAFEMPALIGDQVKDAAQLAATSPLRQAARITHPLLLAHGGIDRRVPIEHATKLRSALEAAHAPVTWVEYKDEAHGWKKPETRIAFYQQMLDFLDANIGAKAAVATAH